MDLLDLLYVLSDDDRNTFYYLLEEMGLNQDEISELEKIKIKNLDN